MFDQLLSWLSAAGALVFEIFAVLLTVCALVSVWASLSRFYYRCWPWLF